MILLWTFLRLHSTFSMSRARKNFSTENMVVYLKCNPQMGVCVLHMPGPAFNLWDHMTTKDHSLYHWCFTSVTRVAPNIIMRLYEKTWWRYPTRRSRNFQISQDKVLTHTCGMPYWSMTCQIYQSSFRDAFLNLKVVTKAYSSGKPCGKTSLWKTETDDANLNDEMRSC